MVPIEALTKSKKSLGAAERAFYRLTSTMELTEIEDHWEAMLYALAQVVKTLAPLKADPMLTPILKVMELDRRGGDPLVSYVYEARNARDHGLAPVTLHHPASTVIGSTSGNLFIERLQIGGGIISNCSFTGASDAVAIQGPGADRAVLQMSSAYDPSGQGEVFVQRTAQHVRLVAVSSERTKRTYSVPNSHQGASISGDIQNVAHLSLNYYLDKFSQVLHALNLDDNIQPR